MFILCVMLTMAMLLSRNGSYNERVLKFGLIDLCWSLFMRSVFVNFLVVWASPTLLHNITMFDCWLFVLAFSWPSIVRIILHKKPIYSVHYLIITGEEPVFKLFC